MAWGSTMKMKRLLMACVFATTMTVLTLSGSHAQAGMDHGSTATTLIQLLPAPASNGAPLDVTLALSDLVDVERALKAANRSERMSTRTAFSRIAQVHARAVPEH